MPHKYKVSKATAKVIESALERLNSEVDGFVSEVLDALNEEQSEHRDAWDNASEKYQEGERGEAADEWINSFDEVISELETLKSSITDTATALENLPDEPEYY